MSALLVNGDALRIPLADGVVQCVVTSPPYYNAREYSSWGSYQEYLDDMAQAWRECYRVLCDGGRIAVNVPMGYGRPSNGGLRVDVKVVKGITHLQLSREGVYPSETEWQTTLRNWPILIYVDPERAEYQGRHYLTTSWKVTECK